MKNITQISLVVVLIILLIVQSSCKKEEYADIPNVYVNLNLDISSTLYIELYSVGGWVNITGGYRGITIYRCTPDEFVAFERCCPYDATVEGVRVDVDPSGLTLTDTICGSTFLILDGSVVSGPATMPLKQYKTGYNGDILHVYN